LINQLPKKVLFKLDLQWNQMILTVIFGFWFVYFNAKFNLIQTRTAALLLCNFPLLSPFFLKKFINKGYSIESYFIKSMKYLSPFIRKYSSCRFSLLNFFASILFFVFDFAVDLPYFTLMAAITSIYWPRPYLHFSFRFCDKREWLFIFWDSRHQRMDYRFYFDSNVVLNVVLPVIMEVIMS
jgi:hypothetical protein